MEDGYELDSRLEDRVFAASKAVNECYFSVQEAMRVFEVSREQLLSQINSKPKKHHGNAKGLESN